MRAGSPTIAAVALSSSLVHLPAAAASAFGKYRLLVKLGQGGMAEVFLAAHRDGLGFEKLVVIKRLKAAVAADPDGVAMFLDEARIAARLNHPNLVQTYELGSVDEEPYLAMEYLEGQPLDRLIHRLGYDQHLQVYLAILSDALAGLHHAHELCDFDGTRLDVVHRDVSPHNLFVTYEGQAKVVDFGIAKWQSRSAEATSTGVVKGKVSYMAPEQALCAPLDRRADLFAMGVILWEVAAGERLWGSLSDMQILQRMAMGELPKLRERRPDAPEALIAICGRALSLDPAGRYATAAEMRDEIEALISDLGRRPTAAEVGQLVAEAFADRRAEARVIIGDQLARLKAGEAEVLNDELPVLDDRAGPVSVRGRSASQRRELAPASEAEPAAPPMPAEPEPRAAARAARAAAEASPFTKKSVAPGPQRRSRAAAAVLLGGVVAGASLFAALRGLLAPAQDAAAVPAPQASAAAPAPPRALVELRIEVTPPDARIFLDDVAVPSNPFAAKFPRDGTGHRIRAEAAGYTPDARLVVFDRDVRVEIALSPVTTPGDSPAPSTAAVTEASWKRPRDARASSSAGSAPGARAGSSAAAPAPTTSTPPGLKVDPTDPWATRP